VVLGAGRDALAAMICIRFSIISKWAEKKRISFTTYTDSPHGRSLRAAAQGGRNRQCHAAAGAAHFQIPVALQGTRCRRRELTRTRKVRRSVINEKYAGIIDAIYGGKRDIPSIP